MASAIQKLFLKKSRERELEREQQGLSVRKARGKESKAPHGQLPRSETTPAIARSSWLNPAQGSSSAHHAGGGRKSVGETRGTFPTSRVLGPASHHPHRQKQDYEDEENDATIGRRSALRLSGLRDQDPATEDMPRHSRRSTFRLSMPFLSSSNSYNGSGAARPMPPRSSSPPPSAAPRSSSSSTAEPLTPEPRGEHRSSSSATAAGWPSTNSAAGGIRSASSGISFPSPSEPEPPWSDLNRPGDAVVFPRHAESTGGVAGSGGGRARAKSLDAVRYLGPSSHQSLPMAEQQPSTLMSQSRKKTGSTSSTSRGLTAWIASTSFSNLLLGGQGGSTSAKASDARLQATGTLPDQTLPSHRHASTSSAPFLSSSPALEDYVSGSMAAHAGLKPRVEQNRRGNVVPPTSLSTTAAWVAREQSPWRNSVASWSSDLGAGSDTVALDRGNGSGLSLPPGFGGADGAVGRASPGEGNEEEEEEDVELNPIYRAVADAAEQSPLGQIWLGASLLVLPSIRHLDLSEDVETAINSPNFVTLHALTPSRLFKDKYIPVKHARMRSVKGRRNSADFDAEGSAQSEELAVTRVEDEAVPSDDWADLSLRVSASPDQAAIVFNLTSATAQKSSTYQIPILSETTVYRADLPSSHKGKEKLRILLLDGFPIPIDVHAVLSGVNSSHALGREGASSLPTLPRTLSGISLASAISAEDNHPILLCIPSTRKVFTDVTILLDPPQQLGASLNQCLQAAFKKMKQAAAQFNFSFAYISGFEEHNAARIRKGILQKSWQAFEQACSAAASSGQFAQSESQLLTMSHLARARLRALFENLTMALCHDKVYAHVRDSKQEEDASLDRVLQRYEESGTSLSEFLVDVPRSLRRPGRLDTCIRIFGGISAPDTTFTEVMKSNGGSLRTPLETLHIIKDTIEAIGDACVPDVPAYSHTLSPTLSSSSHKSRFVDLSMDELLPILSFVVVKSGARHLESLLSYINLFHMGEGDVAKLRWLSTTFGAVIGYLRKDPLRKVADNNQSGPGSDRPTSPTSVSSHAGSEEQSAFARSPSMQSVMAREPSTASASLYHERRLSLPFAETQVTAPRPYSPDSDGFMTPPLPSGEEKRLGRSGSYTQRPSTASSDLHIRPQLIVRHRRRGQVGSSSTISSGSDRATSPSAVVRTASSRGRIEDSWARRRSIDSFSTLSIHRWSLDGGHSRQTSEILSSRQGSGFILPDNREPPVHPAGSVRSISPTTAQGEATSLSRPPIGNSRRRKHSHALLLGSATKTSTCAPVANADTANVSAEFAENLTDSTASLLSPTFMHLIQVPSPVEERPDPFASERPAA